MGSASQPVKLTILHFNDVYNIEPGSQEPIAGAARFVTAMNERQHLKPLILFSGDAFNPSIMSTVTKGKQMVPVLNACGVHCAVYGNHDFDFGVDTLVKLAKESTFPWLMSNVLDNLNDSLLAEGKASHLLECQGKKIGLVGLIEEEWIATLSTIDPENLTFINFVEEGTKLAKELRQKGADYVIALTHMRWPNDERLALEAQGIDLILGGHDHDYGIKRVNGIYIVKSGTDFREFSEITISFSDGPVDICIDRIEVQSSTPEDVKIKDLVGKFQQIMGAKMENLLGQMDVELEGRFKYIRTSETNLGNFVTDIMLEATEAECALLNAGTLRSDRIHPKGEFKVKDLLSILPMVDPIVVLEITGEQLHQALENSVSQYPKLEGRFAQISGMSFGFDPEKPPGERVDMDYIMVQGEYVQPKKKYRLASKAYLALGKDGYDVFKECRQLVDEEKGPRLSVVVQNHFASVKCAKREKQSKFGHRQSLIALNRRKSLLHQVSIDELSSKLDAVSPSHTHHAHAISASSRRAMFKKRRDSVESVEEQNIPSALAPKVEGRIFTITEENRREIEDKKLFADMTHTVIKEES